MDTITFDAEPSYSEFSDTIRDAMNVHSGRFTLVFRRPVDILTGFSGRNKTHRTDLLEHVKFFTGARHDLCYTIHQRTGYCLDRLPFDKVFRIVPERRLTQEELQDRKIKKIIAIQKRIHPNAWDDLKADPPEKFLRLGGAFSIRRKFPEEVIDRIKDAFEHKLKIEKYVYGVRRDLSVSTQMGPDGIFRAWFSSEYAQCANGCYYVLINPTTAAFGEYD